MAFLSDIKPLAHAAARLSWLKQSKNRSGLSLRFGSSWRAGDD